MIVLILGMKYRAEEIQEITFYIKRFVFFRIYYKIILNYYSIIKK